jgi:hypothetical protein
VRHLAFELEDYIGGYVIVRSGNDEEPLKKGTLVRYEDHHSGSALPIVKYDDGIEYLCFASILPYTDALWDMLSSLSKQHQLDEIIHLKHFILADARRCRGKSICRG